MSKEEEIKQLKEELESVKKKLRISEQDVFRLAAEKAALMISRDPIGDPENAHVNPKALLLAIIAVSILMMVLLS
jgi:hypothetical protein